MPGFVYAVFDFVPSEEDELALHVGERLEVLDKNLQFGDGWWQGRNQSGQTGIFPANHTSPYASDIPSSRRPLYPAHVDPRAQLHVQTCSPWSSVLRTPSPSPSYASPSSPRCTSPYSPSHSPSLLSPPSPTPSHSHLPKPLPPHTSTPVSSWCTQLVLAFLASHQLDTTTLAAFAQHDITGDLLLELDVRVLKEEMGIASYGKRMRIVRAVESLKRAEGMSPMEGELPPYTK